tara:strand:- start:17892 stop:20054 length:2163 start_codon:yes stop_codon:yes gene_type:complete
MNLSDEQQTILNKAKEGKNVIVDAVAGTGKTTLILSIAEHLKDKKILQLTYNKSLKFEVREKIRESGLDNLNVHTYHSLAVCYYSEKAHVDNEIRKIVYENYKPNKEIPKIDILVLDESQDMSFLYFQLMAKYLFDMNSKVQLLVLGDYMQGLYEFKGSDIRYLTFGDLIWCKHPMLINSDFEMCSMKMSYRITNQIRDFVNNVLLGEQRMNSCRDDKPVQYIRHSPYNTAKIVYTEMNKLFERGIKPNDIFVLGPSVKGENSNIRKLENMLVERDIPCHVPMMDSLDIDQRVIEGKVVFSTFHSVKGRQRKYVFVVGFDHSYFKFYGRNLPTNVCPNTIYVACTRSKNGLYVLENDSKPYDRPIDFMKMSHLKMKEQPYIQFKGQAKTYFQIEEEKEFSIRKNTSPSDLIKFIPEEAFLKICSILETCFITETKPSYDIEMPSIIKTKNGNFEEISDLNGIAIPGVYYDFIKSVWKEDTVKDIRKSVLYELIDLNKESIKEKKKQFLENMIEKLPEHIEGIKDYLFMANITQAISESLYFKLKQIESYDWLDENIVEICNNKFREVIGPDCQNHEPMIEEYIIRNADEETHKLIDKVVSKIIENKVLRFNARVDIITENTVWEIKCCSELTIDHMLQVVIYAWIWKIKNIDDKRVFKLFNVRTGELRKLDVEFDTLNEIMSILIKSKYQEIERKHDEAFLEDCYQYIETLSKKEESLQV